MKRYFFIEDDLDNLAAIERDLIANGMLEPQIHVLSLDDAGVSGHKLHEVNSLLRRDVVHSSEIGALIGVGISVLSIAIAYVSGLPQTIGWLPFVFLSIILLGFLTWEGGLFGIQMPNPRFRRFEKALRAGRHMLIVDVEPDQERLLDRIVAAYPDLEPGGTGVATPRWLVRAQQRWHDFLQWAP